MGKRVLLADDSITIQKLVEMAFSETDMELLAVSDGRQAISRMEAFRPDVVLADTIMPLMDGYQVCEWIKSQPQFAHVPVVLLTGRFQPFDEAKARAAQMDGRVVKPFVQEQLVELIENLTSGQGGVSEESPLDTAPMAVVEPKSRPQPAQVDTVDDAELLDSEAMDIEELEPEELKPEELEPEDAESSFDDDETVAFDYDSMPFTGKQPEPSYGGDFATEELAVDGLDDNATIRVNPDEIMAYLQENRTPEPPVEDRDVFDDLMEPEPPEPTEREGEDTDIDVSFDRSIESLELEELGGGDGEPSPDEMEAPEFEGMGSMHANEPDDLEELDDDVMALDEDDLMDESFDEAEDEDLREMKTAPLEEPPAHEVEAWAMPEDEDEDEAEETLELEEERAARTDLFEEAVFVGAEDGGMEDTFDEEPLDELELEEFDELEEDDTAEAEYLDEAPAEELKTLPVEEPEFGESDDEEELLVEEMAELDDMEDASMAGQVEGDEYADDALLRHSLEIGDGLGDTEEGVAENELDETETDEEFSPESDEMDLDDALAAEDSDTELMFDSDTPLEDEASIHDLSDGFDTLESIKEHTLDLQPEGEAIPSADQEDELEFLDEPVDLEEAPEDEASAVALESERVLEDEPELLLPEEDGPALELMDDDENDVMESMVEFAESGVEDEEALSLDGGPDQETSDTHFAPPTDLGEPVYEVEEIDEPLISELDEEPLGAPVGQPDEVNGEPLTFESQEIPTEDLGEELDGIMDEAAPSGVDLASLVDSESPAEEPGSEGVVALIEEDEEKVDTQPVEEPPAALSEPHETLASAPVAPGAEIVLSEAQLDVLAKKVAEHLVHQLGTDAILDVAWDVIPELAEAMIQKRIFELEKDAETAY